MFIRSRSALFRFLLTVVLVISQFFVKTPPVAAQDAGAPYWLVRSMDTHEYGVAQPLGLAFSPLSEEFLIWGADGAITAVSKDEQPTGTFSLSETVEDPLNVAFDSSSDSLFVLNRGRSELAKIHAGPDGLPLPAARAAARFNTQSLGLQDARGLTFDPNSGRLFILDAQVGQILFLRPNAASGFQGAEQRIKLPMEAAGQLRGIAFNPQNGHLVTADPDQQRLYELSQGGDVVSTYDLSPLGLGETGSLLFASSTDRTDDPATMNLFMLAGGQIVELALVAPAALPSGTPLLPAALVRTVDMSNNAWSPSSPDPSGIDYWPLTGRFLTTDSEVEEMPPYWAGANVFDADPSGALASTCTTFTSNPVGTAWNNYANEPTGVAINPVNNRIYISDDSGGGKLFEIYWGLDGTYCTADDVVTRINFSTDLEDVAYGNNRIFLAGGVDAEVWTWDLGPNGVLGGGDDGPVTHFDTASLGFSDLEGIGYNADAGTLFIVSTNGSDKYLGETTLSGTLLRAYDLSFMSGGGNLRSDVTYAPSSANPAIKNIYIVSRGVDNGADPNENDGKWWEVSIGSIPSNTPTITPTGTATRTPGPTGTSTNTPTVTPTFTSTPIPTNTSTVQTLTFAPVADASIYAGSPTTNFGSATRLEVDNSPLKHFLLKFTVSGLNGRQVTSAKLRLFSTGSSNYGGDFRRVADSSWQEGTVN